MLRSEMPDSSMFQIFSGGTSLMAQPSTLK